MRSDLGAAPTRPRRHRTEPLLNFVATLAAALATAPPAGLAAALAAADRRDEDAIACSSDRPSCT